MRVFVRNKCPQDFLDALAKILGKGKCDPQLPSV